MDKQKKPLGGWSQLRRTFREMRERTYLANAQARKRASRTAWDAIGLLVAIPIFGVLWWGGVRLGIVLAHALRPGATDAAIGFTSGPITLAGIALLFSPVIAAIAAALWIGNTVVYAIPQARRAQAAKALAGGAGFEEAQAGLAVGAMFGFVVYAVLLPIAILLA